MTRPELDIECVCFTPFEFERVIAEACGGEHDSEQVKYLAAYLGSGGLGVRTLVVERPYIDRHFMEEFNNYYASALRPPHAHTTRVHAFSSEMGTDALLDRVRTAAQGPRQIFSGPTGALSSSGRCPRPRSGGPC